jgi:hypothetical protein
MSARAHGRKGSLRQEGLVGQSTAGAAVGVEEIALGGRLMSWRWRAWVQPELLSAAPESRGKKNRLWVRGSYALLDSPLPSLPRTMCCHLPMWIL